MTTYMFITCKADTYWLQSRYVIEYEFIFKIIRMCRMIEFCYSAFKLCSYICILLSFLSFVHCFMLLFEQFM